MLDNLQQAMIAYLCTCHGIAITNMFVPWWVFDIYGACQAGDAPQRTLKTEYGAYNYFVFLKRGIFIFTFLEKVNHRIFETIFAGYDETADTSATDAVIIADKPLYEIVNTYYSNAQKELVQLEKQAVLEELSAQGITGQQAQIYLELYEQNRQTELDATQKAFCLYDQEEKANNLESLVANLSKTVYYYSTHGGDIAPANLDNGIEQHSLSVYPKETLSVKEMAEMLGVSLPTMYNAVKKDGFPSIRVGKQIKANKDAFQSWMKKQRMVN